MNATTQSLRAAATQARERFDALQPRERWMLGAGVAALLLTLLYLLVWEPLVQARAQRTAALASSRELALRLEQAAARVQAGAARHPAAQAGRELSLMAAVDQAGKQGGLGKAPTRIQPEGERSVRVWFEDVSFDALVRWLHELESRYGIGVQTLDVEPQPESGLVNVRLTLTRAG